MIAIPGRLALSAAAARAFPSIDQIQLRALLRCYFRLSTRGKVAQTMGRDRGGRSRSLLFLVLLYAFMGLMAGLSAFALDVFTFAVVVHGMTFMVIGMAMTAEAGDVLFNTAENDVLRHRPIPPGTLLLAKTLNLLGVAVILAASLNFFPIWFGLAASGARPWFPVVHAMSVILLAVFSAAGVVSVYGLVIRFFDREKFDNFAAWSQVGLSILFTVGYQLVPRVLDRFKGLSFESYAVYLAPLPPAWFAAIDATAAGTMGGPAMLVLAAAGVAATALAAYVAIGKLAPDYGEGLARLSESRTRRREPGRARGTLRVSNPLLRLWLRDPVERSAFRLTAVYMRRDRETKLRLYPALASFMAIPILAIVNPSEGFSRLVPLFTIGLLGTLPLTAMSQLRMSSQHAAADLFVAAPIASAGPLFQGVRKATIYYLALPAVCVAGAMIAFVVPGARASLALGLPGLLALPTMSLLPGVFDVYLPLSQPLARTEAASANALIMWSSLVGMGLLALATYLAWTFGVFWYLVGVEVVALAGLHAAWTASIRRRPLIAAGKAVSEPDRDQDTHTTLRP